MFAPHNKVDNLICTVDVNGQQIDGATDKILNLLSLEAKFLAFGWDVMHAEGNNMDKIVAALEEAKSRTGKGKPVIILMKTEMGNGVDFMMNTHAWHGKAPNDTQLENALAQNYNTGGELDY